eukprot:scaffold5318_cov73-Cyclotella_meneghiniana.AAC.16
MLTSLRATGFSNFWGICLEYFSLEPTTLSHPSGMPQAPSHPPANPSSQPLAFPPLWPLHLLRALGSAAHSTMASSIYYFPSPSRRFQQLDVARLTKTLLPSPWSLSLAICYTFQAPKSRKVILTSPSGLYRRGCHQSLAKRTCHNSDATAGDE